MPAAVAATLMEYFASETIRNESCWNSSPIRPLCGDASCSILLIFRNFFREHYPAPATVRKWWAIANFTDKQYCEHLDFRSRNPGALSSFRPGVNFYFGSELNY